MTQPTNHRNSDDSLLIDNPIDIDKAIQEMQIAFRDGLPWLSRSFGRSWRSYRKSSKGRPIYYPEVFQGIGKDSLNVAPGNDNLSSYCFFRVHDPIEIPDYVSNQYNNLTYNVSAIFWMNLKKVDPLINYDFIAVLERDIRRILTEITFTNTTELIISKVWHQVNKVFDTYTIDSVDDQNLVYPRKGLRFEMKVTTIEFCN